MWSGDYKSVEPLSSCSPVSVQQKSPEGFKYCKRRNFRAVHIFVHFAQCSRWRKYDVSEKIIDQIELITRCVKICPRENIIKGLMRQNLATRKYLRLQ